MAFRSWNTEWKISQGKLIGYQLLIDKYLIDERVVSHSDPSLHLASKHQDGSGENDHLKNSQVFILYTQFRIGS